MEIEGFSFPTELYYHPDHTWAKLEGDKVRVGITPYAVQLAGEISALTLRPTGKEVMIGGSIATLESNKWVGPLKCPVSGRIVESNIELEEDFGKLLEDSYGEGWICVLEPIDLEEDLGQLIYGEDAVRDWVLLEMKGKGSD
ncbi:MAG: glycine cleavage system protein H [Candidatus Hermodarchaeota archaeon]